MGCDMNCLKCEKKIDTERYYRRVEHGKAICHPCFINLMTLHGTSAATEEAFDKEAKEASMA